ncbi:MAG: anti-sigma factor [Chloroflexales bacterium]|nr:anti-sigma factor [Chloroflexales bacterium]
MNTNDQNLAESQLAAYALGALDAEDRKYVEELIATSPAHQEELRQLREVIALLPYAAPAAEPPARVRERLFARITASRDAEPASPELPDAAPRPNRHPAARWLLPGLVAALAALVLALGGLTLSLDSKMARLEQSNGALLATTVSLQRTLAETQGRQANLSALLTESQRQISRASEQIAASKQRIDQLSAQAARDEYVISFVSAPGIATRQLAPADTIISARGEMYMYPGQPSAVVLFSGLPTLQPGQVYQFWLADGATQVAGGTFQVNETGLAQIVVQAPREVNAFRQVMVTVEPTGGSASPSRNVVLAGSL